MLPPLPHPRPILQFSGPRRELHNMVVFLWPYSLPEGLGSLPALPLTPSEIPSATQASSQAPLWIRSWSLGISKGPFSSWTTLLSSLPQGCGNAIPSWRPSGFCGLNISTLHAAYFYNTPPPTPHTTRRGDAILYCPFCHGYFDCIMYLLHCCKT